MHHNKRKQSRTIDANAKENLLVTTDGFVSTFDLVIVNTLAGTYFFSIGFRLHGAFFRRYPTFP